MATQSATTVKILANIFLFFVLLVIIFSIYKMHKLYYGYFMYAGFTPKRIVILHTYITVTPTGILTPTLGTADTDNTNIISGF